jgi:hypothetical protein
MKNCIIILLLTFFYGCKNCDQKLVPYTEQEPYEAIEDTNIVLSYQVESANYNRVDGATLLGIKPKLKTTALITNTDNRNGGTFKLVQKYKTTLGDEIVLEDSKYINHGETKQFNSEQELQDYVQVKSDGYLVEAPTVTISRRITKYKTETKYKPCNPCKETCD